MTKGLEGPTKKRCFPLNYRIDIQLSFAINFEGYEMRVAQGTGPIHFKAPD